MPSPFSGSMTNQNQITVDFDPSLSSIVTTCAEIADIQFVRITADGNVLAPGTYYSGWTYRDAVTTAANYWVDFLNGEPRPDYQQGGLIGQLGYKNGGSRNAWIPDAPQTQGGDAGFYSTGNPGGWKTVLYEFWTYCWCMNGTQCGSWYQGLSWTYTKTWQDQRDGRLGVAAIVNNDIAPPPVTALIDAFNLFNTNFHYVPCATAFVGMERV
jgi:hypothetical protein